LDDPEQSPNIIALLGRVVGIGRDVVDGVLGVSDGVGEFGVELDEYSVGDVGEKAGDFGTGVASELLAC